MSVGRCILFGIVLLASLASVGETMLDINGWAKRSRLAHDLLTVKTETDGLEEHVGALRRAIHALATRRDVQEHVVREELGYVHDNDLVLRFGE
jgi:cell division protein FtsB